LPGEPVDKSGVIGRIKRFFRNQFDAFLLYSSFSKGRLVNLGISSERAFVATNVGDVKKFLRISDSIKESASEARRKLSLKEKFTVLYTGTLDRNKRPEMMLDLAGVCDAEKFNFVLLGAGEMLEELRDRAARENLSNVYLPGRVTDSLAHYFRASDVLLVPGRGGIVISEGMAFGLPVVTYQADGTEYDLIQNQTTGFILEKGDLNDFRTTIEFLQNDIKHSAEMGKAGRQLVENQFTTDNMVNQILKAARYAKRQALAEK
jgi:glycosyltransferase involved in cell wall biosynthesis